MKRMRELNGHYGTNTGTLLHDTIDDLKVDTDVISQLFLCKAERDKKFVAQNFAWRRRFPQHLQQGDPMFYEIEFIPSWRRIEMV